MINNQILSSGIDIVNVNRIRRILSNKKDRFLNKIFTIKEIEYITQNGTKPTTVAGMFAGKEAVSKALGRGIGKLSWKDIEILHDINGKPKVNLNNMELSISHEEDYAIAVAITYNTGINIQIKERYKMLLPPRIKDSHKGTYGRVAIIGGSKGMTGAPYLSSQAALRTGSGLVYTIVPKSLETIMSLKLTEAIIKPVEDCDGHLTKNSIMDILNSIDITDVIAFGPGIGTNDDIIDVITEILNFHKGPIVIDADGINSLSKNPKVLTNSNSPIIITPHPGELARLLGISLKEIQENRIYYSKYTAEKYNIIVVLKGFNTIVSSPKGEIYINSTGNPGMATAGSGDILTGIIASLIGQGLTPIDGAELGVFLHGLAGDMARQDKGEYGLIATDVLENIPYGIKKIQV